MFADELSAHRYLERLLWPSGMYCPHCGSHRVGKLKGSSTRLGTRKCYGCRKTFSIVHGTLMSGSHVPLHKWLQAIYLTECGMQPMRAHHLCQILNVSPKTAASMTRRIGEAANDLRSASTSRAPSVAPLSPRSRPCRVEGGGRGAAEEISIRLQPSSTAGAYHGPLWSVTGSRAHRARSPSDLC